MSLDLRLQIISDFVLVETWGKAEALAPIEPHPFQR